MNPRGILALANTILTATAVAIPNPANDAPQHGAALDQSEPYYLRTKYGLNTSAEFKYFQEPGNGEHDAHYDSRFFKDPVPKEQRSQVLTHIIHSYFDFFNTNRLETWIAHGTLLGWWWNGKVGYLLGSIAPAHFCRSCHGTGTLIPRSQKPRFSGSPMTLTGP